MQETITFELKYFSPDGKVGDWENQEFEYPLVEDLRPKDRKKDKLEDHPGLQEHINLLDELCVFFGGLTISSFYASVG